MTPYNHMSKLHLGIFKERLTATKLKPKEIAVSASKAGFAHKPMREVQGCQVFLSETINDEAVTLKTKIIRKQPQTVSVFESTLRLKKTAQAPNIEVAEGQS